MNALEAHMVCAHDMYLALIDIIDEDITCSAFSDTNKQHTN